MGGGAELLSGMERDMIRVAWEEGSCSQQASTREALLWQSCYKNEASRAEQKGLGTAHI